MPVSLVTNLPEPTRESNASSQAAPRFPVDTQGTGRFHILIHEDVVSTGCISVNNDKLITFAARLRGNNMNDTCANKLNQCISTLDPEDAFRTIEQLKAPKIRIKYEVDPPPNYIWKPWIFR